MVFAFKQMINTNIFTLGGTLESITLNTFHKRKTSKKKTGVVISMRLSHRLNNSRRVFIPVHMFGKDSRKIYEHVRKGDYLQITGKIIIKPRVIEQTGERLYVIELEATNVHIDDEYLFRKRVKDEVLKQKFGTNFDKLMEFISQGSDDDVVYK